MYNAEQKTRFIKDLTVSISYREVAQTFFNTCEKYERDAGADLCTFTAEQLRPVFEGYAGIRSVSAHVPKTILKSYARWCLSNGIPGATDAAMHLEDSVSLEKVRTQTVRNPKQLQSWMDILFAPEKDLTTDNLFRTWLWLGYAGLDGDDAITVLDTEVDLPNMRILHNGREYPIYREGMQAIQNCVELDSFAFFHPLYTKELGRIPGNALLRGSGGMPTTNSLRARVSAKNKKALENGDTDLNLTYTHIWMSGIFYRVHEDELAGLDVDFMNVPELGVTEREYEVSSGRNTQDAKRRDFARKYRRDYDRWKMTLV